jgi:hypothetical protein
LCDNNAIHTCLDRPGGQIDAVKVVQLGHDVATADPRAALQQGFIVACKGCHGEAIAIDHFSPDLTAIGMMQNGYDLTEQLPMVDSSGKYALAAKANTRGTYRTAPTQLAAYG